MLKGKYIWVVRKHSCLFTTDLDLDLDLDLALCWVLAAFFQFIHPIRSRCDSLDGDQPVSWPLPTYRRTHTDNKASSGIRSPRSLGFS
jgi:hypothetical protein